MQKYVVNAATIHQLAKTTGLAVRSFSVIVDCRVLFIVWQVYTFVMKIRCPAAALSVNSARNAPVNARTEAIVGEILQLFQAQGDSQYGREAVTQREHALQSAALALDSGADSALITAALVHDIGHLLHDLPEDAPKQGVDDRHETSGSRWLSSRFGESVTEPVRLHVAAKRYLCAVDPTWQDTLSPPSQLSLQLQGGPMSATEVAEFEAHPHFERAVQLRRWDDAAKVPELPTPPLEAFAVHIAAAVTS